MCIALVYFTSQALNNDKIFCRAFVVSNFRRHGVFISQSILPSKFRHLHTRPEYNWDNYLVNSSISPRYNINHYQLTTWWSITLTNNYIGQRKISESFGSFELSSINEVSNFYLHWVWSASTQIVLEATERWSSIDNQLFVNIFKCLPPWVMAL